MERGGSSGGTSACQATSRTTTVRRTVDSADMSLRAQVDWSGGRSKKNGCMAISRWSSWRSRRSEEEIRIAPIGGTLFPFLRRHDPDQVQGSGSTPSQHRAVHPSEWPQTMQGRGDRQLVQMRRLKRARKERAAASLDATALQQ